jgi:hypothetical protein
LGERIGCAQAKHTQSEHAAAAPYSNGASSVLRRDQPNVPPMHRAQPRANAYTFTCLYLRSAGVQLDFPCFYGRTKICGDCFSRLDLQSSLRAPP